MAKALIVDDETTYVERLGHELANLGFEVVTATSAETAMSILRETPVDFLIVDILLPGHASGLDIAEMAKRVRDDLAIVVITGHGTKEHRQRSEAFGAMEYLEKPFELSAIRRCAREFLHRRNLLREVHRLEQQLEEATRKTEQESLASPWPIVRIDPSGSVLAATGLGMTVLGQICDPELPRPIKKIDADLLRRLREPADTDSQLGAVRRTVFRRDGELDDYSAYIRPLRDACGEESAVVLFVSSEEHSTRPSDDLWLGLFLKATAPLVAGGDETER